MADVVSIADIMKLMGAQARAPDPLDFSDKYNTPIPPKRKAEFDAWVKALPPNLRSARDYDLQGAFLNGTSADARDHMTDTFKKPNHTTFSDASQYHGIDGYVGGSWTPKGFAPSRTNLQFRPLPVLQQYFQQYEPGTPLLAPTPAPTPTGSGGLLTIGDLMKYGLAQ